MAAQHKLKPILTIVAGPNGSGKSTAVPHLQKVGTLGVLVNADEIAASLSRQKGEPKPSLETQWEAAISAEEMRWAFLDRGVSFATETVMSDKPRWTAFIEKAKQRGYKVVLYFITTVHPSINVKRIEERVKAGGHEVDPTKTVSRYHRVMEDVLPFILPMVDEAILFDNSSALEGAVPVLLLQGGKLKQLAATAKMPDWAKSLI